METPWTELKMRRLLTKCVSNSWILPRGPWWFPQGFLVFNRSLHGGSTDRILTFRVIQKTPRCISLERGRNKLGIVVYTCNLNTREVETGGSELQGHPWLHREFKTSLGYRGPCLTIK